MDYKKLLPIIGIGIFVYILSTMNLGSILSVLTHVNIWFLLLSIASLIPMILLINFEWQLILKKHKIYVSYKYSLKNIFIGYFYGFITPGGFGGYTRALYLRDKSKAPLQKCIVDILLFNAIDYLAFLSLGLIGGIILSEIAPEIFPVILLLFLIVIFISVVLIRKKTGKRVFQKILSVRFLASIKQKWGDKVETIYDELPRGRHLLIPYLLSLIGWMFWFTVLYLISPLFSIHVSYFYFIAVVATANVVASIPISIYGLGTREAALITLFSLFGMVQENVIVFSLFWFVLSWLIPGVIGAVVTIFEIKKQKLTAQKNG
jgi:uncharacterized protein (TIRG00374 family)